MPISEKTRKAAMEAFTAIEKYDRERFSHGPDRVYLYYSDIDGDWLNEFIDRLISSDQIDNSGHDRPSTCSTIKQSNQSP